MASLPCRVFVTEFATDNFAPSQSKVNLLVLLSKTLNIESRSNLNSPKTGIPAGYASVLVVMVCAGEITVSELYELGN